MQQIVKAYSVTTVLYITKIIGYNPRDKLDRNIIKQNQKKLCGIYFADIKNRITDICLKV